LKTEGFITAPFNLIFKSKGRKPMAIVKYAAAAVLMLMLAAPAALAHHLWIEPSGDGWAVIRGFVPDEKEDYDPRRIQAVEAFGKNGRQLAVDRIDEDGRVFFTADGEVAMATAWSAWGYRVNTTRGKRLIGRAEAEDEGLRVLSAFHSTHYAKSLFSWMDAAGEPAGLRFEIIPLENLLSAPAGGEINLQLLFDGKPLAGTAIHTNTGEQFLTDESGSAVVVVPEGPEGVLYARHRIDVEGDEKKDYKIFTTFLTFTVKQ